jgi:hypothetical protein
METAKRKAFRSDSVQTNSLIKSAKTSARNAIRASKALGLTVTYIEQGAIVNELPDGTKEIIKKIETTRISLVKLKKGMIFYAKK